MHEAIGKQEEQPQWEVVQDRLDAFQSLIRLRSAMTEAANRIQELEAALAQKTRECEDLKLQRPLTIEAINEMVDALQERKTQIDSLEAQVEQLQRQVAEMSNAATSALSALAWLPEGPVRQRVQEVIAELRDALASRARTK